MSTQFNPGGLQGWTELNPSKSDVVMPQWYERGCVGSDSCPCLGTQPISTSNCPGLKELYRQQSRLCGIKQWVEGFHEVGKHTQSPSKIVLGAKSWCGGDKPSTCRQADTGIWGYEQMIQIIAATGVGGVYFWDLGSYYNEGYYKFGNPINKECDWANRIAIALGLNAKGPTYGSQENCKEYTGRFSNNCYANSFEQDIASQYDS